MTWSRDIRLDADEIIALRNAADRRLREIGRQLDRHTGAKPGMIARLEREQETLRSGRTSLEVARQAVARKIAHTIAEGR